MTKYNLIDSPYETWEVSKKAAIGSNGIVVAQEIEAANVGAMILRNGGNAVDAAVATALALCVTEPWMSGLGGGGFMLVYLAKKRSVQVVDFGMIAPSQLDSADYQLSGNMGGDLFGWPAVENDANFHGAKSIAIPGAVAGYSLGAREFGRKNWKELLEPAICLAERGHRKTWWTTLNVAAEASLLTLYSQSKRDWLPGGVVPSVLANPEDSYLNLDKLAATLRDLSHYGPEYFYNGRTAEKIIADVRAAGGSLSIEDLYNYSARILEPLVCTRGRTDYNLVPEYSAGPTFANALARLMDFKKGVSKAEKHTAIASALIKAYRDRLNTMGHAGDISDRSCTTHINTLDSEGNMAVMTTTLLSRFGSRFVSPSTGVLMNNGINWFDPRPGRPNSIAAGVRPLSNMCPLIALRDGKAVFGLGGSGGRKILPAVFQVATYIEDFGMDLQKALAYPRVDISAADMIVCDSRFDQKIKTNLKQLGAVKEWTPTTFPSAYAVPSGLHLLDDQMAIGAAHPLSPLAGSVSV